jgi:chromosome segregation ATPase
MGRNTDNSPVGHTCPMIDGVLDSLNSLYTSLETMSKGELDYYIKTLEKIRSHNGSLRDWGNELYKEKEELENEVEKLREEINNLERCLDNYKEEVKELENKIYSL